eukprot:TRINITY_DN1131_c0_g1_i1.p2 TRINITY_DN1131_c0_g1~~TRINITY_DN1131_c0_g1_i1.p2  ORF type:complete len:320 (+),score=114.71 TRINITY_DN1131_c0_g1_i1:291-1250(+)
MPEAALHDGHSIPFEVHGDGPALLLPVNPQPVEGSKADEMRKWGVDPSLGRNLIEGLRDAFRVIAFDYEGHVMHAHPKPDTLTPEHIACDFLAVADAAGAHRFAYYGYSWLALSGLQLAIRTDRLTALVMGGFPPLGGPYAEMLRVTAATHAMAVANADKTSKPDGDQALHANAATTPAAEKYDWSSAKTTPAVSSAETPSADEYDWASSEVSLSDAQTRQFVTLYEALRDFDDRAAQHKLACPRLCFAGAADVIEYGAKWGGVRVDIAGPLSAQRSTLDALGWTVRVLDGLDHTQAMQAKHVLLVVRPWLCAALAGTS